VNQVKTIPLPPRPVLSEQLAIDRVRAFQESLQLRRTVRHFSSRSIPRNIIESAIAAAGSAPSGANLQPWHFVAVSESSLKHRIREAAEKEERHFYSGRAPEAWRRVLAPLGTDPAKPFLEEAPWLIAIFSLRRVLLPEGTVSPTYYPVESVGIATGILIAALHEAGLAVLTHTPSPMRFLNVVLDRPKEEKPFLLLVVGHPAADARVPDIERKPLDAIATFR